MAKKFSAYVQAHDASGKYFSFAPGDTVPAWLEKTVGDHVLAGAAQASAVADADADAEADAEAEAEAEADTGTEEGKEDGVAAGDEPDFTKPAEEAKGAKNTKSTTKATAKKG